MVANTCFVLSSFCGISWKELYVGPVCVVPGGAKMCDSFSLGGYLRCAPAGLWLRMYFVYSCFW